MDYGRILSRSWQITWRWKFLWVLGLLAGGMQFQTSLRYQFRQEEVERFFERLEPPRIALSVGAIVALTVLGILLVLGFWALSCIARGGLIAGVRQIEEEGTTTLRQSWRAGVNRFWTVLGIDLLSSLVLFLPMAATCLCLWVVALQGLVIAGPTMRPREGFAALGVALLCAVPAVCVLVLLGIAVGLIHAWAQQAAIQEGMGAAAAFARGWEMLRKKLGPSLLLWLLLVVIAGVLGIVAFVVTLLFVAPILVSLAAQGWTPLTIVLLVVGALLVIPTLLWAGSVWSTFQHSCLTLAYRQLAGLEKKEAIVPAEVVPPTVA